MAKDPTKQSQIWGLWFFWRAVLPREHNEKLDKTGGTRYEEVKVREGGLN